MANQTMPGTIKIAVVQMNASPAPTQERLARAEHFVVRCVNQGAQLVVLPEVFNTGYEYSDQNFSRAEPLDGLTAGWMRNTAARYHVHLAGSFLRRDQNEIYNTLLLAAPDHRQWHYDKNYPWFWERVYFQKGTNVTVADTDLGKIGFLICWDVAHPGLWKKYAGKVECMIVSSCPPRAFDSTLVLPDGRQIVSRNTGALVQYIKRASDPTFGAYLRRQAAFLGVPLAHSSVTGVFHSAVPNPRSTLAMLSVLYPPLLKYRSQFTRVCLETGYFNETYIADRSGRVLQSVQPNVEGFAIGDVPLPDTPPSPKGKQPSFGIPKFTYLMDAAANKLFAIEYRKKIKTCFS